MPDETLPELIRRILKPEYSSPVIEAAITAWQVYFAEKNTPEAERNEAFKSILRYRSILGYHGVFPPKQGVVL